MNAPTQTRLSGPDRGRRFPACLRSTGMLAALFGAAALLIVAPAARAADCTVNATPVNFGHYDPLSSASNHSGVASVTVSCRSTIPQGNERVSYSLLISSGLGGTYQPRQMLSCPDHLSYILYRDAARTQIWGDGSGGSFAVTGALAQITPGAGASASHTIYGRIPASQNATAGNYTDTLVVTLIY